MTYCDLKQYKHIQSEINALYDKLDKIQSNYVSDVVQGSYPVYPFTIHSIKIKGEDTERIAATQKRIDDLSRKLEEIELYIDSIPDSYTRQIFTYKYIEGKSWREVAQKLGGYNSSDSVRMAAKRFFNKKWKLFVLFVFGVL